MQPGTLFKSHGIPSTPFQASITLCQSMHNVYAQRLCTTICCHAYAEEEDTCCTTTFTMQSDREGLVLLQVRVLLTEVTRQKPWITVSNATYSTCQPWPNTHRKHELLLACNNLQYPGLFDVHGTAPVGSQDLCAGLTWSMALTRLKSLLPVAMPIL